jgi:hypothetical protein
MGDGVMERWGDGLVEHRFGRILDPLRGVNFAGNADSATKKIESWIWQPIIWSALRACAYPLPNRSSA